MKINNHIVKKFPIAYENEEFVFYFYDCDILKKEINNTSPKSEALAFYIKDGEFFSDKLAVVSGKFVIGKLNKLSNKFPYPVILDCDQPYLIEVNKGKIVEFTSLSELVVSVQEGINSSNDNLRKMYCELCAEYGEAFMNDVLPYEDIIYYFD